ncbi:hypothetical protein GQ53DRAFT_645091, partial [Thozetella sp. PMI_491]
AQSSCSSTVTVNSPAEATNIGCSTLKGLVIGSLAAGTVDIGSVSKITDDLVVQDNGLMINLQGNFLSSIGGTFKMDNVTAVTAITMPSLNSVGSVSWTSLPYLQTLSMALTTAKSIIISDTFLSSLSGIDVASLATMDINNNAFLANFTTKLSNLSDHLNVNANNKALALSFPDLTWIANMTILNVASFSAPALVTVNGSAKFDTNYFTSFTAPNLTSTKSGDISFVGNEALTNISFPVLTSIGGGLLIANNTNLSAIDGFSKLKAIGGAVKLRGSFSDIEFPALGDVKGAFDASSTANINSSCKTLEALSGTGGGHPIQGTFHCTSNNETANTDTGTGTTGGSGGSSGSGNNTAAGVQINHALLGLGLAVVGGFAHLW